MLQVNTSCTEGLAGFNELLEVLSDLAAGAAQQLRCSFAGRGLFSAAPSDTGGAGVQLRRARSLRGSCRTEDHFGTTAGGVEWYSA